MRMQSAKHTKGWWGKMYIQRIEGGIFRFFLLLSFVSRENCVLHPLELENWSKDPYNPYI